VIDRQVEGDRMELRRKSLSFLPFLFFLLPLVLSLSQAPFDLDLAYNQLMMSYAAYCPADQLQPWDCIFCKNNSAVASFVATSTITNETTNSFGYVGYTGTIAQVVFRGTIAESIKNWITDLDAGHTTPYPVIPGALVHTGFLDALNSVKDQVVEAVKNLTYNVNITEIYFSGHSLGAALSVLAAVEIGIDSGLPITCYNFGDPRVGNIIFADYFDNHIQTSWRMVNQRDIIPHLPGKALGFWHIATEVWWPNSTFSEYMTCDPTGEDPNCSNSLGILADSIPDHLHYMGVPLASGHPSGCR